MNRFLTAALMAVATPALAQDLEASRTDSVQVQCDAFQKSGERIWTTTKPTIIFGGTSPLSARVDLPSAETPVPSGVIVNGVDLIDLLIAKCAKQYESSAGF
jgi:hypothetical protein